MRISCQDKKSGGMLEQNNDRSNMTTKATG